MRAKQLACVAGVLGAGVLAAWPFRQHALPAPALPASVPLDLTLRHADVTLAGSPPGDDSPAIGLDLADRQGNLKPIQPAAFSVARPSLEELGPPPEMPITFARAQLDAPPGEFVPRTATRGGWSDKQMRPRTYTLRDGDTLEDLAERFLGTQARAREIFEANRAVLTAPDLLPVGIAIVIPPRDGFGDLEAAEGE
jgi:nucleoid-associated protein YgaU